MTPWLAVAVGSALGACVRFAAEGLPADTLVVNLAGSFAMACFLAGAPSQRGGITGSPAMRLFFTTGFCGGLTTFSVFSAETWMLAASGGLATAGAYAAATVGLSIAAALAGFRFGRAIRARPR